MLRTTLLALLLWALSPAPISAQNPNIWTAQQAKTWQKRQGWRVGADFLPSTAINQLEMWQAETFDPTTIDRELGWAEGIGMSVMRVYLHDLAWKTDPAGFKNRMSRFLGIADRHGIKILFTLLDDCWNPEPAPGPQPAPRPGVHNSGWVRSPHIAIHNDSTRWNELKPYVQDVLTAFKKDRRIYMWDLYNEPGNSGYGMSSLPLLRRVFEWAWAVRPDQPLTAGIWYFEHPELNDFQIKSSDVVSFHDYSDTASLHDMIQILQAAGRPLVCTEYMARTNGSRFETHLPVFKRLGITAINWGLVSGKSNTIFPWGSPEGTPEPVLWFHDIFRKDGTPFSPLETDVIKYLTGKTPPNGAMNVSVAEKPGKTPGKALYAGNRAPLQPEAFLKLPAGSVRPRGWLLEVMTRQKNGLNGHLGEISAWLQKDKNAWLSPTGQGEWGWEEVPYWLKGYLSLAIALNDRAMLQEAKIWIEGALASRRPDGNFGPVFTDSRGVEDFWPKMIMLYCLQTWYDHTGDRRVTDLMRGFFRYQLAYPEDKFLDQYWQKMRGGDNLSSVLWLYNRTGEPWLLDLARKIHRKTADWTGDQPRDKAALLSKNLPVWWDTLPDWHNVNVAQAFREPAVFYQVSGEKRHLDATYRDFHSIRDFFGQVPGGMFGADEDARPGYDDPRQAVETCGMVEQMNSDEQLLRITGDIFWADHAEEVAFNTYPAALMPDMRSLRYLTSPNMVLSDDQNHAPGIQNKGPFLMMNPFSSRCCQHNHGQGWPYFCENLWMATPDGGAAAVLFAESEVRLNVGAGAEVRIEETGRYPFDETIRFVLHTGKKVNFPFYVRIPAWAAGAQAWVNGERIAVQPVAGKFLKISRKWSDGDAVTLRLPMKIGVKTWEKNHRSVSVNYGPLTFSLKIEEYYRRKASDETAIGDSKWQKGADREAWPSFEILPGSPWNYGLLLDDANPVRSFSLKKRPWPADNFPFTHDGCPFEMTAKAKKIPEWQLDPYGLCAPLKDSPVYSEQPVETVMLIPMGAARLRVSALPVIAVDGRGNRW